MCKTQTSGGFLNWHASILTLPPSDKEVGISYSSRCEFGLGDKILACLVKMHKETKEYSNGSLEVSLARGQNPNYRTAVVGGILCT